MSTGHIGQDLAGTGTDAGADRAADGFSDAGMSEGFSANDVPALVSAPTTGESRPDRPVRVIVIGGGIAGLVTALRLAEQARLPGTPGRRASEVTLLVKGALGDGSTARAQGGIAAAVSTEDSPALHIADTLSAGAGLCEESAVRQLCTGGPEAIDVLRRYGVAFDEEDGEPALGLEGAHSVPRILRAGGDTTGQVISRALTARLRASGVQVRENSVVADLLLADAGGADGLPPDARAASTGAAARTMGVLLADGEELRADAVVLATGGAGQLFSRTTNPDVVTGDGIAMALRAGARVADLEFVQFHPTVLDEDALGADARVFGREADGVPVQAGLRDAFLISEAVRGEGARLIDATGEPFMHRCHPAGDLAPRDVVARGIVARARQTGAPVRLDATALGEEFLARRFPGIDAELRRRGIDWARTPVPVTPAAHYLMGGIVTDAYARTTLPGLYAVGEAARTGVHGANRLASNSLLEGVVFGLACADAVLTDMSGADVHGQPRGLPRAEADLAPVRPQAGAATRTFDRTALQTLLWEDCGVHRTEAGLARAQARLRAWAGPAAHDRRSAEDRNLLTVARAMVAAARQRKESVGAHVRDDAAGMASQHPAPAEALDAHAARSAS